jgi:hypothetical protein
VKLTLFLKADAKLAADVLVDSGGVICFSTGVELFNSPEMTQITDICSGCSYWYPPHILPAQIFIISGLQWIGLESLDWF